MIHNLFVLAVLSSVFVESEQTNRTYLIKKDFVSGAKAGEFTVYDHLGKQILYRMETKFGLSHQVIVFRGQQKKNPLAQLKAKITALMYKATISIRNEKTNSPVNGTIQQNYKFVGNRFLINYLSQEIVMETDAFSLDTKFHHANSDKILAKFHKRVSSLFWRNKYDLQILSDSYPDELFFLAIAAKDHTNKKIHKG